MNATKRPDRLGVLFLGGAKRVAMARMFRKAADARGLECDIYGYELSRRCALACEATEIFEGLRWSDDAVYADLDRVVREKEIDIVVPFVDGAVGVAAEYARHRATVPVFSPTADRAVSELMFDKVEAAAFFESKHLLVPATYHHSDPVGKLIAKPRRGSASKGIVLIDSEDDLSRLDDSEYLIQERIDRREEITVDCYVGVHSGLAVAVSPRVRRDVAGGEVVDTITVYNSAAVELVKRTLEAAGLRGAVTVQLIRDLDNGRLMIMEINPRLGGGAVASVHAGVDLPGLIIDDCLETDLAMQYPVAGVETLRYLDDVVFYPDKQ